MIKETDKGTEIIMKLVEYCNDRVKESGIKNGYYTKIKNILLR